jgi:hypothetical protein
VEGEQTGEIEGRVGAGLVSARFCESLMAEGTHKGSPYTFINKMR